ncbi:MAG: hypothetical protein LVQ96_07900 [Thermoplasmatales archaeon]|nr:hypothetical protein [Thermoplasmatales archaeon]MCW6171076.1 hypothetical protein [Thermoplasmatales archaeon]
MSNQTATKNQIEFIKKLELASTERGTILENFLNEKKVMDVDELTIDDASKLIEELKKVKTDEDNKSFATGKQISLLNKLQDTDERIRITGQFLDEKQKETVNILSVHEASELIDKLMKLPSGTKQDTAGSLATDKQLKFVKSLQNSEKRLEVTRTFLIELKKSTIEELTRSEASALIDSLKES